MNYDEILKSSATVKCEKCGCPYFKTVFTLKDVPATLAGASENQIVSQQIYICTHCKAPYEKKTQKPDTNLILQ